MKLTRGKRIALELLGPPFIGAALMISFATVNMLWEASASDSYHDKFRDWPTFMVVVFGFAYVFVGAQSIIYTAIMEWRFKRGLDPRSWRMVGLSSTLGFASGGAVVIVAIFGDPQFMLTGLAIWGGTGLLVGFLMGLLIKSWSAEKETTGGNNP